MFYFYFYFICVMGIVETGSTVELLVGLIYSWCWYQQIYISLTGNSVKNVRSFALIVRNQFLISLHSYSVKMLVNWTVVPRAIENNPPPAPSVTPYLQKLRFPLSRNKHCTEASTPWGSVTLTSNNIQLDKLNLKYKKT